MKTYDATISQQLHGKLVTEEFTVRGEKPQQAIQQTRNKFYAIYNVMPTGKIKLVQNLNHQYLMKEIIRAKTSKLRGGTV